jgi:hypothetical protein
VFLKVYADESYDSEIYCCGSFLGWPKDFYYSGLKWEDRLQKDGLRYFRASECEGLYGEFDPQNPPGFGLSQARARASSLYHDMLEILESSGIGGIVGGVLRKDFAELTEENPRARKYFGTDIMLFSYKTLINATANLLEQDCPELPNLKAAFLLDEHSNWKKAEAAYRQLKEEDAACAKRMLCVGHADDEEYPGLQMADLMAHQGRHKIKNWLLASRAERRGFSVLTRNHRVYFVGVMNKENLLAHLGQFDADEHSTVPQ